MRLVISIQFDTGELDAIHEGFDLAGILEEHGDAESQYWILGCQKDGERIDGEPAAIFDSSARTRGTHPLASRFREGAYPVGVVLAARRALTVLLEQASKRAAVPDGGWTPDYMERCAKQVPRISSALRIVDAALAVIDRIVVAMKTDGDDLDASGADAVQEE